MPLPHVDSLDKKEEGEGNRHKVLLASADLEIRKLGKGPFCQEYPPGRKTAKEKDS